MLFQRRIPGHVVTLIVSISAAIEKSDRHQSLAAQSGKVIHSVVNKNCE